MSHVIAICGTMGSGKSTTVDLLAQMNADCFTLYEDDFNPAPLQTIEEVRDWAERGGNIDEFDLSSLVAQLRQLCEDPGRIVFLETQFGRMHPALRPLIDLQCWIDVEPDIALARKVSQLARQFAEVPAATSSIASLQWIAGFCENYFQTTRTLFIQQRATISWQSDVQISGRGTPTEVCERVWQSVFGVFQNVA
jgi:hypothetical protein